MASDVYKLQDNKRVEFLVNQATTQDHIHKYMHVRMSTRVYDCVGKEGEGERRRNKERERGVGEEEEMVKIFWSSYNKRANKQWN